jgi:hypothetical protein
VLPAERRVFHLGNATGRGDPTHLGHEWRGTNFSET